MSTKLSNDIVFIEEQQIKKITFIDLCSGIGAGRLGLELQGFKCVNYSEIDAKAIFSYQSLHQETEEGLGDLFHINTNSLPFIDLIIAGFPCQPYSIVGQRKGLEDDRGQLIYGITRILQDKQVPYFIFENVKGLLNTNKGNDFITILNLLDNTGYNVYYKVLNSINFGVPQSRERVYFVGIRKDIDKKMFKFPEEKKYTYDLSTILDMTDKLDKNTPQYKTFLKYLNNSYNINKFNLEELLKEDYLVLDTRQSDLRLYRGYVPTIRKGRQGILYTYKSELYSLSKNEALRLQGFPDSFINKVQDISKSAILEQVGNAMTVNVIEALAKQLKKIWE